MSPVPLPTRVFLACGVTDMRKGFDGLAVLVQQVLVQNPHSGALFAFRGKRGIWSSCCGSTGKACACSRSGSTGAASSGR